jgi:protein-L-isoaspartate(D-aspartate) O-methyltransferase
MKSVTEALQAVRRRDFLLKEVKERAELDAPLPIGYGQTNSQPYTVQVMLEWLEVDEGQKVLDIGSGSGWTSALLSYLVGDEGRVYAVEVVPELLEFGRDNCDKLGIENITFFQADKMILGLPEHGPYDRILVSASAENMPEELFDQLASPGKMVVPVAETIYEISKDDSGVITKLAHPGFVFVPLIS